MAEISEEPPNPIPPQPQPQPQHTHQPSESTIRKAKPGLKRLALTLSVLVSFIFAFPFLYKSVEIHRAPLPFREIDSLSSQIGSNSNNHNRPSLSFPCHFQAIFVNFNNSNAETLESLIFDELTKLTSNTTSQCSTLSVKLVNSGPIWSVIGAVDFGGDDESIDEALAGVLGGEKVYSVVVVKGESEEVKGVVGKYRHGWVVGRVLEVDAAERAAEMFVKVFVNGGKEEGFIHGEFMPVGADGRIVLSFNLLNSNPHDWVYDWDFQAIDDTLLAPIIKALGPVANISVESQVLYHTPKSSFSFWDDKRKGYIFTTKDLPFFVNSNEWHLDTSIAAGGRSKILQFVVYVPSAKECPLLLQLPNGEISKTNGFISPMWGGVIVWNPQVCLKDSESQHPIRQTISHQDLQKVFEVFVGQFRQLFGLKSDNLYFGSSGTYSLLASEKGFSEWELDFLARRHTCFNLHSCATTLGSLSRLVQSLPRMIIMDEIGKQVKYSLEAANLAQRNASLGLYDASAVSSRQARSLAEDAFFHPSIMSVSYYSFEHCFAVYSPFFLPVSMHVLLAALREWRRYQIENRKYLAWKVEVQKNS
ncbi:hypothetical protein ACB094_12G174900 [Castanea mollissima]